MEVHDLVIVGCGIYGIAAARTYLEVHPESNVVILESENVVGGTWSTRRVYDTFWTQTPLGMAEFSDVSLELPPEQATYHGLFPAKHIATYLQKYLKSHIYNSRSLQDRVLFKHQVSKIEKVDKWWSISCKGRENPLRAAKLIIASGMTSEPRQPSLPGHSQFKGHTFHQKYFGDTSFQSDPNIQSVAVLGGGKSAADIVYSYAKAGKSVHWIIRSNGCGPVAHVNAAARGPYESSVAMFNTRLSSSFSPSIFANSSKWHWFLHGTKLGRRIVDYIWTSSDMKTRSRAGYKTREGRAHGFANLEPETPIFWQNDGSGIEQHPDFWATIADSVNVYRSEIIGFTDKTLALAIGISIEADVLICATGWELSSKYFALKDSARLGLPIPRIKEKPVSANHWARLEQNARVIVLQRFPKLGTPPSHFRHSNGPTPYRLYNGIAPTDDKSVAILGHIQVGNNFAAAECQALWATAYLDGRLRLPSKNKMEEQIALVNSWCSLRYLDKGQMGVFYYFDLVPYVDMLLKEMGLNVPQRSWLHGLVKPLVAQDLASLLASYKAKYE